MVFITSLRDKQVEADSVLLFRALRVFVLLIVFSGTIVAGDAPTDKWWGDATEQALAQAGTNRQQLVTALEQTSPAHREKFSF
jgi:hypothetical protein